MPPLLVFVALALALAFAVPRARLPAALLAIIVALACAQIPLPASWGEGVFLVCWATVVAVAASVHLPQRVALWLALVLAVVSGIAAGTVTAVAGHTRDVVTAAAGLALILPGAWLVGTRRQIAIKVVSSWVIAIAVLSAALPLTPTPGYVPDHME